MSTGSNLPPVSGSVPPGDSAALLAPEFAALSHKRRIGILLAAALITSVEISNRVSINVILPDMQGNVAADVDQISWVIILYNMGFICSMVVNPWMSRVFGARRHLTICALLYTMGALGCFLSAHNLTTLLISRVIMGLGGGLFLVRMVIIAGLFFPGKTRLVPLAYAYVILFSMQTLYPPVIGALSDNFHWNYAFLLDLPFLLFAILLLRKLLPRGHIAAELPRSPRREDYWGVGFILFALVTLQIFSSRGERDLWFESPLISICCALSLVSFALFVWWEMRPANSSPVLHLRHVFRLPPLRRVLFSATIVGAILGAGLYVIPQYLRNVQDYSALQTGEFFSAYAFGFGTAAILTLRVFIARFGSYRSAAAGMVLLAAVFVTFIYSWTPSTPGDLLAAMLFLQGVGLGLAVVGVGSSVTGQVAAGDIWEGDTTYFFVRQLGNTFGLTAVTILFDRRMTLHSSRLLDVANRLDPTTSATLSSYAALVIHSAGAGIDPHLGALALFLNNVVTQSRLLSYIDISFFLAALGVAGAIAAIVSQNRASAKQVRNPILHF
jgi:MFS transporter, DHA2 family, multidrug resistance protein